MATNLITKTYSRPLRATVDYNDSTVALHWIQGGGEGEGGGGEAGRRV